MIFRERIALGTSKKAVPKVIKLSCGVIGLWLAGYSQHDKLVTTDNLPPNDIIAVEEVIRSLSRDRELKRPYVLSMADRSTYNCSINID